jgi:hypothetical protein
VRRDEQDAQLFSLTLLNAVRRALRVAGELAEIRAAEAIWNRERSRRLDGPTQHVAWRKLAMLDAAEILDELAVAL